MKILITESQLKSLILEQQKIKVTDKCGKTQEFDYQQWYYNGGQVVRPDLKCYTWDGKSYVYNYSCHFKNWTSMTKEQRDTAISGVKGTCVGSYKELPNLITLAVKDMQSFSKWVPQTIQDWVDWITWFISWLGPQGKALATAAKGIQGMAYMYFGFTAQTLRDQITKIVEGLAQLLDIAGWKIKVPGFSNWVEKITKFLDKNSFGGIITKLISKGQNVNEKFNSMPKWGQAVVTLIAQAVGAGVSIVFNWIVNNILNPLYGFILKYNTTIANGLKTMIDYLLLFSSHMETANVIITDSETKGILNLTSP